MHPIIALLTDFGTTDIYVGVMKGVIATFAPTAQLIDLTHAVPPQNVMHAAYLLKAAYRYFPPQTIFLCVVDPGVGTNRRPVAIRTDHGLFIAPDNGLLSPILQAQQIHCAVELPTPGESSHTFHGRDIFAPAAGRLARGESLEELGSAIASNSLIGGIQPRIEVVSAKKIKGEVIRIDHFGNLITSLGTFRWLDAEQIALDGHNLVLPVAAVRVELSTPFVHRARLYRTYGDAPPSGLIALISSDGQLELAVNGGSAAEQTKAQIGHDITLLIK
ncbi:MAG: SAM-dependent chlorinase/fluorinase [Anaerolineae bacterium]